MCALGRERHAAMDAIVVEFDNSDGGVDVWRVMYICIKLEARQCKSRLRLIM